MTCEATNCEREAVYRCYWPGQTICFCPHHKDMIERTSEAMGFVVEVQAMDAAAEIERLNTRLGHAMIAVGFFESVIRSGEQWSEQCENWKCKVLEP